MPSRMISGDAVDAESDQPRPSSVLVVTYNIHSMGGVPRSTTNIVNGFVENGYIVKIASISPGSIPMKHALDERVRVTTCNSEIPAAQQVFSNGAGRVLRRVALSIFKWWKPRNLRFVQPKQEGIGKLRDCILELEPRRSLLLVTDVNSMDYVERALALIPGKHPAIIGQYKGSVDALSRSRRNRIVETYRSLDLLLCLTPDDANSIRAFTDVPVDWITNPVPEPPLDVLEIGKKQRFVTLGRLASEKGLSKALEAWKMSAERLPGWELVLYGEGPLRNELQASIKRLGIQESVRLAGRADQPLQVLRQAHALLLPSQHEGFGMVIAEAASVGTPTIAFDCSPGVRMQIESGENGLLVPAGDSSELAEAIVRLASDRSYTAVLGESAKDAVARFNVKSTMLGWDELFAFAMSHNAGAS